MHVAIVTIASVMAWPRIYRGPSRVGLHGWSAYRAGEKIRRENGLDEWRHYARSITDSQLKTICSGTFAVSGAVVGEPREGQTDQNIQASGDEEAASIELDTWAVGSAS